MASGALPSPDGNKAARHDPDVLLDVAMDLAFRDPLGRHHAGAYDAWCALKGLARSDPAAEDGYLRFALPGVEHDLDGAHLVISGWRRGEIFDFDDGAPPAPRLDRPFLALIKGGASGEREPSRAMGASSVVPGPAAIERAAEAGDPRAMLAFGKALLSGTKADRDEGYEWILAAAENGLPDAVRTLGWCCETATGTNRHIGAALHFYRHAALSGSRAAYADLARLRDRGASAGGR